MAYRPQPSDFAWLALYLAMLASIVLGLYYGRQRAFAVYGTQEAQQDWNAWRDDAKKLEDGPVSRRMPKSGEPPALVLMRDYFGICLAIAVALSSVLFGTFVFLVRGALLGSATFGDRSPPEPKR